MFDPITLALVGGAVGGLLNKKAPIKGALLGAGAGFTGGSLAAGGLLGGAGAAGGAAGGTGLTLGAGGSTAAAGGAAGGTGLTSSLGSGLSLSSPTAGLTATNAAQTAGITSGSGMAAPASGFWSSGAASAPSGGALSGFKSAMSYAKPVGEAAMAANAVNGLVNPPQAPIQSGLPQRQQADFGGLLGNGQVAQLQQKRLARRGMVG